MAGHYHSQGHEHQEHQGQGPSHLQHKGHAPKTIRCMVITCSDTRSEKNDISGSLIKDLLTADGHEIVGYYIVKDEPDDIKRLLTHRSREDSAQVIIVNGGTGISQRDSTFEVIDALLEKRLDGFGELFRYLSFKEIGSSAMISRATAGLFQGKVIFSLPGSEPAVQLAMKQLILPEMGHIVGEMNK